MKFNEVSVVMINLESCVKFVVARLLGNDGSTKLVVRATRRGSHESIYGDLYDELCDSEVQDIKEVHRLGGGKIKVDSQNKIIRIWGESIDYGMEPDRQETAQLIQTAYPDYKVESY